MTPAPKTKVYYDACMNMTNIDQTGRDLYLDNVHNAILASPSLENTLILLLRLDITAFLNLRVGIDSKNSSAYALFLSQSGLGLQSPVYYVNQSVANSTVLKAYATLIHSYVTSLNVSDFDADQAVADVLFVENALANIFVPAAQLRNPDAVYNPMTVANISSVNQALNWTAFFAGTMRSCCILPVELPFDHDCYTTFLTNWLRCLTLKSTSVPLQAYRMWEDAAAAL